MNTPRIYTYYWWFNILVFCFFPIMLYLFGAEVHKQYQVNPFGKEFWTALLMTFFLLLVAIGYCSHVLTYRLVYHEDKFSSSSSWDKITALFSNYFTRNRPYPAVPTNEPDTSSEDFPGFIFCNGYAHLKREVALQNYLVTRATNPSYCPPVPSLRTYRINHWHQMILIILLPIHLLLTVWILFFYEFQLAQLLIHTAITCYEIYVYRYMRILPEPYFPVFRQEIHRWLVALLIFWILLYPKSILSKYTVLGYLPLIAASIILAIIAYQFIYRGGWRTFRSRLYDSFHYLLLLCLPFTFFNIVVTINCIPYTAPVYTLHLPVQVIEDTDASMSEKTVMVKTIPVAIHGGILGVPWYSDKNIVEDKRRRLRQSR